MPSGTPMNCVTLILAGTREGATLRILPSRVLSCWSAKEAKSRPNRTNFAVWGTSRCSGVCFLLVAPILGPLVGSEHSVGQTPSCRPSLRALTGLEGLSGSPPLAAQTRLVALSWAPCPGSWGLTRCAVPCQLTHCLATPRPPDLYAIAFVWKRPRLNVD
jgi:hypothetical protein